MARSDTTEANFPFTMLYFQGNFHLAYCVCKCKHHPCNTVLGMSWKISIVTFILQMSKSHVQSLEDERKTSMLQGGLLHIAQKEVVCLKHVHTHTHTQALFYISKLSCASLRTSQLQAGCCSYASVLLLLVFTFAPAEVKSYYK